MRIRVIGVVTAMALALPLALTLPPGSAGAQITPTTPVITNIPVNPVFDGSFTSSVSTDSDGVTSVTSSTTSVCTVEGDNLTVDFVGVGSCTLTAHVAASATYDQADGSPQTFAVGQATPSTPTISNLPTGAVFGGSFVASVSTNGDGLTSVASNTTSVCTVGLDNVTVSFVGVGTCSLTPAVGTGTNYTSAVGSLQTFAVGQATPSTPTISNLPTGAVFGGSFMASVSTNGDGARSVASNTTSVCTVGLDNVTVSFVGVGTCSLTPAVGTGTNYTSAVGSPQTFAVGQATPSTPTISNLPTGAVFGGSFMASVSTNGDGARSIASNTTSVCTVGLDNVTVSFVGVGTCSLTASVGTGTNYTSGVGSPETFSVGRATPTTPVITDLPSSGVFGASFIATVGTNGDGMVFVTSNTLGVCTVGPDGLTVSYVGVGTCSLTAAVAGGTNYASRIGTAQTVSVGRATPSAPTISNLPVDGDTFGNGGFTATVSTTTGDSGVPSVASTTLAVCTVEPNGLTVTYITVGTCSLTAQVASSTDYKAATGSVQSFVIGQSAATPPTVENLPAGGVYAGGFVAVVGGSTNTTGTTSVSSSTPGVCSVGPDDLTVSYVGIGTCSLTAVVAATPQYGPGTGTTQSFSVGRATPTSPVVTNFPGNAVEFGSFYASVGTNGDGFTFLTSNSPGVCVVGPDGHTVTFVLFGTCSLTASVAQGTNFFPGTGSAQSFPVAPAPRGYWLVGSDGGIFSFGSASFHGSMGGIPLQRPVVGITPTADRKGYWLVASDGGIFSFGDSAFYGSIPGVGLHPAGSGLPNSLDAPIVGMVPSSTGHGYFMVASDGGVFAFGDAHFEGSCPGIGGCYGTAVAVMPDSSGRGYWLVTNKGAVYGFGDAPGYGSPPPESVPVVSAVATPDGRGYWIVYSNGAVFAAGDAVDMGAPVGYVNTYNPATAIFPTADGRGYWVAAARGDVFSYGDAPYMGSMAAAGLNGLIIAGFGF